MSETKMRRTRVTPLRQPAATDASGGDARQQKITHAHESPFYYYAQFPHPFAITYREKKYSRIHFWTYHVQYNQPQGLSGNFSLNEVQNEPNF
jgi:hypothetical protein